MPENVDTMQQMTSGTPAPRPKNRKLVAAGKAIAEKTRQASEAQKKAFAEAQIIIANQNVQKKADPPVPETTRNDLTTTQWLRVISILFQCWRFTINENSHGHHLRCQRRPRHHLLMQLNTT